MKDRRPFKLPLQRFPDKRPPLRPEQVKPLKADHPAMVENRPLFPGTVVSAEDAPRLLVSGENSKKLGKVVTKGPLKGYWIYSLTLPERTTCPRSCHMLATCYGNAMHLARRHAPGPELERRLMPEVTALITQHTAWGDPGILIRLHSLGDFYSLGYLQVWERILTRHPNVHVFGYTAFLPEALDEDEAEIGWAIARLRLKFGRQFSILWSSDRPKPGGATVIDYVPTTARVKEGLVCPAETEATQACATCGLCWNPNFRDDTIVFVLHGMGVNRHLHGPRPRKHHEIIPDPPFFPGSTTADRANTPLLGLRKKLRRSQSVGVPQGSIHVGKQRKPSPNSWSTERTGPAITEAKVGDKKVRIIWPEPQP